MTLTHPRKMLPVLHSRLPLNRPKRWHLNRKRMTEAGMGSTLLPAKETKFTINGDRSCQGILVNRNAHAAILIISCLGHH